MPTLNKILKAAEEIVTHLLFIFDDIKNTGTLLRVFAIKPIIMIACVIHCFCVFHKNFNGQQHFFLQELLHHNFHNDQPKRQRNGQFSNGLPQNTCMQYLNIISNFIESFF